MFGYLGRSHVTSDDGGKIPQNNRDEAESTLFETIAQQEDTEDDEDPFITIIDLVSEGKVDVEDIRQAPTAQQLIERSRSLEQLTINQIGQICILSPQFLEPLPSYAEKFLGFELDRIEQQYEQDREGVELARTITQVMSWLVSAGAVVASVIATPAMGKAVQAIGGVTLGVANEIIGKIAEGIQRGDVDPTFLDKLAMINKDEVYFQEFYDRFKNKSYDEINSLIVRSYRTYQEILLIPTVTVENVLKQMGHESMDAFYQWSIRRGNSEAKTQEFIDDMFTSFLHSK